MTRHAGTVLMAGGGSGGHISPGIAVAEALAAGAPAVDSIFACSSRDIDRHMLTAFGAAHLPTSAVPPALHPRRALRFLRNFRRSRREIVDFMESRQVGHVLALGGFVAAPAVAAARRLGVPVTLLNLDRPPGRANRWIAKRCDDVLTAIPLPDEPEPFASAGVTGMPVRRAAIAPGDAATCRTTLGLDPARPVLLVTGASQGATSINRFVIAWLEAGRFPPEWQLLHLSGAGGAEPIKDVCGRRGVDAVVEPFLDEIGLAWGAADVAISRAGASSVAEAALNRVPTIFLPYPYHRDQHQRRNAAALVAAGAAIIEDDAIDAERNLDGVGGVLDRLLADDDARHALERSLQAFDAPRGAEAVADHLRDHLGPV